tara:strand:+ start:520 stop:759 length:240 start_codon:yes stop_codon:yes gene_type:complete
MKKLYFTLALFLFAGSLSIQTFASSSENTIEIQKDDKKDDKKKKKKKKKRKSKKSCCADKAKTCASAEVKKSCCAKDKN